MVWKKYAILTPPFLIIGILLAIYLPLGQKHYAILVAFVFWATYYAWVYIEKKRIKDDNKPPNFKDIKK
jgi:hypothetical protein